MDDKIRQERALEILHSAQSLYEKKSYKDISFKEIAQSTSLTRTSIYNYYKSKEEIFLALLSREYILWKEDIEKMSPCDDIDIWSKDFASLSAKRKLLFKILATSFFDIEGSASFEAVLEFKKTFFRFQESFRKALFVSFSFFTEDKFQAFRDSFFPFVFGIYPYTQISEKTKKAMIEAGVPFRFLDAEALIENIVSINLKALLD